MLINYDEGIRLNVALIPFFINYQIIKNMGGVADILVKELSYIYCHNCRYNNGTLDKCDECHRKMMGWKLSEDAARKIEEDIIDFLLPVKSKEDYDKELDQ